MKYICLITTLSCIIFCSCRDTSPRLEYALQASEANRAELEKVLKHYSQNPEDSLKLQAALFLIENISLIAGNFFRISSK